MQRGGKFPGTLETFHGKFREFSRGGNFGNIGNFQNVTVFFDFSLFISFLVFCIIENNPSNNLKQPARFNRHGWGGEGGYSGI